MAAFTINALAVNTQHRYSAYVRYYLAFCRKYDRRPIQPSDETLQLYVSYLARTCAYRTIKTYLNGVRVLHLEQGLPNPVANNFNLDRTLMGIKRDKGDVTPNRKLAITPEILIAIIRRLDLFDTKNVAFAAAILVGFFGFFRKANLVPKKLQSTADMAHLERSPIVCQDVSFLEDLQFVWITLRHIKTIQFNERILRIPLPAIPRSILCLVAALHRLFSMVEIPLSHPAFSYLLPSGRIESLTHRSLVKMLKSNLSAAGYDAAKFAGHSFRRDGAIFAFRWGAPPGQIKQHGDWRSNCYMMYLEYDDRARARLASSMRDHILLRLGGGLHHGPSGSAA
jgi:hypothetical protein